MDDQESFLQTLTSLQKFTIDTASNVVGIGHGESQYRPLSTFTSGLVSSFCSAGTMRTAQALYSGILANGSKASMVSRLAAASAKCMGIKTTPTVARWVTQARRTMVPRRDETRTACPSSILRRAPSAGLISM